MIRFITDEKGIMSENKDLHWWQRGVIYQIYPRSFMDSNGDGIGDLQGIIDKLDYLNDGTENSLGIDAIWISPFYPSPMKDFGYDIADYCGIDPMFGDMATFDRLLQAAHKRGIKVVIDYVPNHSSDQHEWFKMSRSSRDNPKRDWYIWKDAKPDGSRPNNWGSMFGGPAWTWDEKTGQYYFHQFVPDQPDLNWRNPEVRQAMVDVLRFWLERGVDGFRMDVVYLIMKHPDMPDQPDLPNPDPTRKPNDIYGRQQHIYDENYEGIQDIIKEFRQLLDEFGDTVGIAELWLDLPEWVQYYGEKPGEGMHLPFNFRLIELRQWNAEAMRQSVDELEAIVPEWGWPNYVLGSHDIPRMASRFGQAAARTAAMLLLTLRGTPTLYNGDELGIENADIPPEKAQDPQGVNIGGERNRDINRTPMQWDASTHAGFSTVEPWLPVSPDYETRNVAVQGDDPDSILSLYRRLIWYRKQTPALYGGSYRTLTAPEGCYIYLREKDGQRIYVALNFTDDIKDVTLIEPGRVAISTHVDRDDQRVGEEILTLRANEGVIIELA